MIGLLIYGLILLIIGVIGFILINKLAPSHHDLLRIVLAAILLLLFLQRALITMAVL